MTHTALLKNESYLIITSTISIGVLTGHEYFDLALAALLIIPFINFPTGNIFSNEHRHTENIDK